MTERKPAPGRVEVLGSHRFADCWAGCPNEGVMGDPFPHGFDSLAEAADALRDHLRTEHADLWEECEGCEGSGIYENFTDFGQPYELLACPTCHGRGYIERSAS